MKLSLVTIMESFTFTMLMEGESENQFEGNGNNNFNDSGQSSLGFTKGGNSDFWTLVAVASREDSDPQGRVDVDLVREGANSLKGERVVYLLEQQQAEALPEPGAQVFTSVLLNSNQSAPTPLDQ